MPLFQAKKEVYVWIKSGQKTIEVRKGDARRGDTAVFQSGAHHLRLPIVKYETGHLTQVMRQNNYRQVIPNAETLQAALDYLQRLYGTTEGTFTAYYLGTAKCN